MSKARTLANLMSDNAELADGQISVAEVVGAAPLASPDFTGTLSLAGTDLTPDFAELNHVNGVTSAIQTQMDTKAPSASPTFTGTVTTDVLNIDEASLLAIATDISDTAVDVFVYDTSKDSDGGAWRKRTQHTSWYNETLNTATRGSRKEFPAVAVIVAESLQVTIYDGDDPDMPMWMVFNASGVNGAAMLGRASETTTCVAMLNGQLEVGRSIFGLHEVFFIDDRGFFREHLNVHVYTKAIVDRNGTNAWGPNLSPVGDLVNDVVNDVAMTVLPNAPIDAATGLPRVTVAVATDGGTSVIRDNGTVVDIVSSTAAGGGYDPHHVSFDKDNRIIQVQAYDLTASYLNIFDEIPSADIGQGLNYAQSRDYNYYDTGLNITGRIVSETFVDLAHTKDSVAIGYNKQLTLLNEVPASQSNGMVAYITKDYSTGWQVGSSKLATLSDTDDTNVTGANLISNGTFSNTTGWTALNSTISIDSNRLKVADNGGYTKAYASFATVVGKTYTVSVDLVSVSGQNAILAIGHATPSGSAWNSQVQSAGSATTMSQTRTATHTTMYVELGSEGTNFAIFDNVVARLAEPDRSVNGNGLQVFNTVNKTAVASGADLVSYRSSGSSYLRQPQAGGLVLTNDFSMTWWQKYDGSGGTYEGWQIVEDDVTGSTNYAKVVISAMHQISTMSYLVRGANLGGFDTASNTISSNVWHCLCLTKVGSSIKLYIDGSLKASSTGTIVTPSNPYSLELLRWSYGTTRYLCANSELSLFRTSNTVPSPEQIAKIYNDEKHLFQAGAQATLYGNYEAVTALAHDDATDLLHVGTSAGRSVFQGLRRVENTTTAVGTTISASNGLVAED